MSSFKTLNDITQNKGMMVDGDWVESKDQDPLGNVRLIQLADIGTAHFVDRSSRFMTQERANELKCTFLKEGDILIARMPDPIGRACIFPGSNQPCVTVVDICIVRVNPEKFNNKWLMYMINSSGFFHQILEFVSGSTRKRIARKKLEALGLNCPPLETQKQIAAVLEKADQLRKDCQQMEQELNSLAQSVFIDMFGDPMINPKGWNMGVLGDGIEYIGDIGSNGSNDKISSNLKMSDEEDYALMIRTTNLNVNNFTKNLKYVSKETYETFSKSKIYGGEIIMNKIGSAGKFWIMPDLKRPVSLGLNQLMIRLNSLSTWYVYYYFSTNYGQNLIQSKTRGATTQSITKLAVKTLPIMVPPLSKQEEFSMRIEKINEKIAQTQQEFSLVDTFFNALMQKAFKGELNLDKSTA